LSVLPLADDGSLPLVALVCDLVLLSSPQRLRFLPQKSRRIPTHGAMHFRSVQQNQLGLNPLKTVDLRQQAWLQQK
jgi:hypothetical protein